MKKAKIVEGQKPEGNVNREIREKEKEAGQDVGLVELVPPMEGQKESEAGNRGRGRGRFPDARGRAELVEVLERYGVSLAGFDRLRSDAYEKHIAGRSLAELEQFYEVLLGPMRGYVEMMALCPKWGKDSKPPHWTTLQKIKERIMAEQSVREWRKAKGLIAARTEGGFHDDAQEFYQEGMEILAEELLAAKADGKLISENLKVVDRLLKAALLEVRERREAREDAKFAWVQGGKQIKKLQSTKPQAPQETADQMFKRVYGMNPFEKTEAVKGPGSKVECQAGTDAGHRGAEAQSGETKFQNPESKIQTETRTAKPEIRADEGQQAKVESPGDDRQQSKVEGQTGTKADNREIHETAEKKSEEKPVKLKDERPEWAKVPLGGMIQGPSEQYRRGVKRCEATGLPMDVATGWYVHDQNLGWNGPTETRGPSVASGNPDKDYGQIQY